MLIKGFKILPHVFYPNTYIKEWREISIHMIFAIRNLGPSSLFKTGFEYYSAPITINAITTPMIGSASTNATPMNIVV